MAGRTRSSCIWERRCSSARRPARSSVTAAICRAKSVGSDVSRRGWRAAGVGDEGFGERTNGGGEGANAGPRCGVGDSGVDARLSGGVGGSGRGVDGISVIALRSGGELSSRFSVARAPSSCGRTIHTYGQGVRTVCDATGWGGEARTFCTSPAISCVRASFRAADCCRTRMAPLRERGGMGEPRPGAGAGVGAVSYRSSSSASRRASWASSSATRRRAAECAARSRSHSSRSTVSSAAEYARAAAVHVVCGCSCGLDWTVDHRE